MCLCIRRVAGFGVDAIRVIISASQCTCEGSEEWYYAGVGQKACGGPWKYIAYSSQIDTTYFLKLIEHHKTADGICFKSKILLYLPQIKHQTSETTKQQARKNQGFTRDLKQVQQKLLH